MRPSAAAVCVLFLLIAILFTGVGAAVLSDTAPGTAASHAGAADEAAALARVSHMPVLSITTDNGELPQDDEMIYGRMAIYSAEFGGLEKETVRIGIRMRGNTSKRFPKNSYRVIILDKKGEKRNVSIAGLRSDDDWILNPMYTDTSKIRETLAYELWDAMNSSGQRAASSRIAHSELYLNGEYWGLYGIQERIDRKQVDGSKRSGILYKVAMLDYPTVQELLDCKDETVCRGFELDFAGAGVREPWEPAAAYMALHDGEAYQGNASLSLDNLIDYGLWAMLTQAHDCHFKNQFLNCVYQGDGYMIYKIPWDLNNTFGDIWRNDAQDTNHTRYGVGELVLDGMFEVLLEMNSPELNAAVQRRWTQLREKILTEENIIARANALYAPLYDALERDTKRWPQCGMGDGNALNIRDIEDYVQMLLPRMDAFVAGLKAL